MNIILYKGLFINYVIKIGGRGGYPKKIIIYYVWLGGEGGSKHSCIIFHEISIDEEQENEEDNRVMISEGGSSVVRILNLKEWLKNPWMPV